MNEETARGNVLVVLFDLVHGRGLFTNVGCQSFTKLNH